MAYDNEGTLIHCPFSIPGFFARFYKTPMSFYIAVLNHSYGTTAESRFKDLRFIPGNLSFETAIAPHTFCCPKFCSMEITRLTGCRQKIIIAEEISLKT